MTVINDKDWTVRLRWLGNICAIGGYFILLHVNPIAGSIVKMGGFLMITPFCYKAKLWDVLGIAGMFTALDLSNIMKHTF